MRFPLSHFGVQSQSDKLDSYIQSHCRCKQRTPAVWLRANPASSTDLAFERALNPTTLDLASEPRGAPTTWIVPWSPDHSFKRQPLTQDGTQLNFQTGLDGQKCLQGKVRHVKQSTYMTHQSQDDDAGTKPMWAAKAVQRSHRTGHSNSTESWCRKL